LAPRRSTSRFFLALALLEKGLVEDANSEIDLGLQLAREAGTLEADLESLEELRERRSRRSLDFILSRVRASAA
jgi:hypothetical protein